jgi:hypothetical protein
LIGPYRLFQLARGRSPEEENVPGFTVQTPVVDDGDGDGHDQRDADDAANDLEIIRKV